MNKRTLIRFGIPFLAVAVAGTVFFLKPFEKEKTQLDDLRGIAQSEKEADSISSQFGDFLRHEQTLPGVSPSVSNSVAEDGNVGYTAFAIDRITAESAHAAEYPLFSENSHDAEILRVATDFEFFFQTIYE